MNLPRSTRRWMLLALLAPASIALTWSAQTRAAYPERPIRLLVPFAPGGTTDAFARRFSERYTKLTGHPMVVENKPGASGSIATQETIRATADGHTLLFATSTILSILPSLKPPPPFDPARDLTSIALVGISPLFLSVNASLPVKDARELVALLRANPGKYSYGHSGSGSAPHLAGELMKKELGGLALTDVPYKGSAPALQDTLAGITQVFIDAMVTIKPHRESGRLRVLAVLNDQRSAIAPEVPTLAEAGLTNVAARSFQVLAAPAGTPAEAIRHLQQASAKVMADKNFRDELLALGIEPVESSDPASTRRFIQAELERWAPVIQATGASTN